VDQPVNTYKISIESIGDTPDPTPEPVPIPVPVPPPAPQGPGTTRTLLTALFGAVLSLGCVWWAGGLTADPLPVPNPIAGTVRITGGTNFLHFDWSSDPEPTPTPVPVPPPTPPPVPPIPTPAPVVTGPIHVTLVTDPAADSQANAPLRTALAINAAFPALDAYWHHRTTDAGLNQFGLTTTVATVGKPCLIVQDKSGKLLVPASKAPDTEADVIALVKSLRGIK
jgi:hypothetical protein